VHTHVIRPFVAAALLGAALFTAQAQTSSSSSSSGYESATQGPVRIRQPAQPQTASQPDPARMQRPERQADDAQQDQDELRRSDTLPREQRLADETSRKLSEFERFVQRNENTRSIRRFGSELMLDRYDSTDTAAPLVPSDYLLNPGDELVLSLWGSVDADLRLLIDRSGRINIPRVGPVMLAGVRYGDAADVIRRRVAQVFRNFDLSVSLAQLRGIRVFVTGFVDRPGTYTVSSLSSVLQGLLRAGGPSAAGSFRRIELRRGGQGPMVYDLYDLLLKGDRGTDRQLQPADVIHVGPVGRQIAVVGSVNRPAIFELKDNETVADALQMAGGFTAVADPGRLSVERVSERTTVRIAELRLPQSSTAVLSNGDILRAFSAVSVALPQTGQAKRVRVEGEVLRPGEYILPPNSYVSDALKAAGGTTPNAFIFGTEFTRESVRMQQQENYERALRDLEIEFTKAATTQRTTTADEAAAQATRSANTTKLIEGLRTVKPTGRIVLQLMPDAQGLPELDLQDGDRILVPARPTTVGVFGSVFNGGSYLFGEGRHLSSYMALAGGPTRGADTGSTFVIRANGSVISTRQSRGWFGMGGLDDVVAEPGDTIFVPEETDKTTFIQNAKDWAQILSQFGLGLAAIRVINN
jgi:protein involved in polysaccharide export with SLBB domain